MNDPNNNQVPAVEAEVQIDFAVNDIDVNVSLSTYTYRYRRIANDTSIWGITVLLIYIY